MDELFEALTLIQTGAIRNFPVILIGSTYWQPLVDFLNRMVAEQMIGAADLKLLVVTDDLDEAVTHLERHAVEQFGLQRRRAPRASFWLGERKIPMLRDFVRDCAAHWRRT